MWIDFDDVIEVICRDTSLRIGAEVHTMPSEEELAIFEKKLDKKMLAFFCDERADQFPHVRQEPRVKLCTLSSLVVAEMEF